MDCTEATLALDADARLALEADARLADADAGRTQAEPSCLLAFVGRPQRGWPL